MIKAETQYASDDPMFQTLLATALDGIIVIDDHGIVQVYNPACQRLFGYSVEEVIGRNINMLMPPPYHEEHDSYLEHYRGTGEKRIIGIGREVVGRRKDRTTFPFYLSVGEGALNGKKIFVGIIAIEHIYILILEMFLWTTPKGIKSFGLKSKEFAEETSVLAANQGLYNGFLAAGLLFSIYLNDETWSLFFVSCVIVAALYGAYSTKGMRILYVQGIPAIITLLVLLFN